MIAVHPIPSSKRFNNLIGLECGRLKVVSYAGKKGHNQKWNCICQCGGTAVVHSGNLTSGMTQSCGCIRREQVGDRSRKHGKTNSPEYITWQGMLNRCRNPKNQDYGLYGGRGISVCERWHSFEFFLADMGNRPTKDHSIDRFPNKDGNYEPGNCRWASDLEQSRNTSQTRMLTHNGVTLCATDWAIKLGLSQPAIAMRIARGLPIAEVLGPRKRATTKKS